MAYQQYSDVYPIILLGDASVGKTCIIQNFAKGNTSMLNYRPTLGIDYLGGNRTVKAQIWDTAGQENYRSITVDYMRKAHGALIVFDLTNAKTFRSVGYWVETLRERAAFEHVQIILVGNKADRAQYREVSVGEAQALARQMGISYCQVTANDLSLLGDLFRNIAQKIEKVKNGEHVPVSSGARLEESTVNAPQQKKGCC